MSHKLIGHNQDLKKLRDEGYEIEIKNNHLLIHNIPYVNSQKEILFGILVCPLDSLSGDKTERPNEHKMYFKGEYPCDYNGENIKCIQNESERKNLAEGIEIDHCFSNKPEGGYNDYYEKVVTYTTIIESHAQAINRSVTAKNFNVVESDESEDIFKYIDTNSSRADIQAISEKLKNLKIAIVGLGGTGSYVLDFVAKTPVKEIHLFDGDDFLSHNAFRCPGSASLEELRQKPKKVKYLAELYSKMRNNIVPHVFNIFAPTLDNLLDFDFVFVCIDQGGSKKDIVQKLTENKKTFIDVGVGINEVDMSLIGSVRTTAVDETKNDHVEKRISFSNGGNKDYEKNIQIAEINALNAVFAVIKWKKMFGFYHDQCKEYHSIYDIGTNNIYNDEVNP